MRSRGGWLVIALALVGASVPAVVGAGAARAAADPRTQGCIQSVPEPGTSTPVNICYTLYKPPGADAGHQVPLIFHSHGWGGSRTNSATAFADWLADGYGVLSFDQRGFGQSGGKAHIENPAFEGQDVRKLVDLVASLDWVEKDGPGDPHIGAIGGSYGGGYQFVGAFTDLMERGKTRFDALAPEITWWDLKQSLAPQDVVRSLWATALFAAGANALPDEVKQGFAYGAATGDWPKGQAGVVPDLDAFFAKNGPKWHVSQGRRLDIPVIFGQGITDNLFNLNQGLTNFQNALTAHARRKSIFVGYNGGHALPSALPMGTGGSGDPCSAALAGKDFETLSRRFFDEQLKHKRTGLSGYGSYHLATADGKCLHTKSLALNRTLATGPIVTTSGPGAPMSAEVAKGPMTVAGISYVDANVTALAADAREFFALAVGTTPADAKIVQNNMMPLHETGPVTGAQRTIELPAVAVNVPAGQSLFLTVSPFSDMSFGHGARTPGAVLLQDVKVRLHTA